MKWTLQLPVPLVIVIVADPLPLPEHAPAVVIATAPSGAVAATGKVVLYAAVLGADVVTVIA